MRHKGLDTCELIHVWYCYVSDFPKICKFQENISWLQNFYSSPNVIRVIKKTDEMYRACSMHGRNENPKHFTQETTRERDHFTDLGEGDTAQLKLMLKNRILRHGLNQLAQERFQW